MSPSCKVRMSSSVSWLGTDGSGRIVDERRRTGACTCDSAVCRSSTEPTERGGEAWDRCSRVQVIGMPLAGGRRWRAGFEAALSVAHSSRKCPRAGPHWPKDKLCRSRSDAGGGETLGTGRDDDLAQDYPTDADGYRFSGRQRSGSGAHGACTPYASYLIPTPSRTKKPLMSASMPWTPPGAPRLNRGRRQGVDNASARRRRSTARETHSRPDVHPASSGHSDFVNKRIFNFALTVVQLGGPSGTAPHRLKNSILVNIWTVLTPPPIPTGKCRADFDSCPYRRLGFESKIRV